MTIFSVIVTEINFNNVRFHFMAYVFLKINILVENHFDFILHLEHVLHILTLWNTWTNVQSAVLKENYKSVQRLMSHIHIKHCLSSNNSLAAHQL